MTGGFVDFTVSLARLNKYIQKLKTDGMGMFGLKGVHTLCLYQLMEHPEGMTFSELAESCDLDRALVSRLLKELLAEDLIRKDGQPGKYKATYFLSDKGHTHVRTIPGIIDQLQAFVDQGISPEELEVFYQVLGKLTDNMELLMENDRFGKLVESYSDERQTIDNTDIHNNDSL